MVPSFLIKKVTHTQDSSNKIELPNNIKQLQKLVRRLYIKTKNPACDQTIKQECIDKKKLFRNIVRALKTQAIIKTLEDSKYEPKVVWKIINNNINNNNSTSNKHFNVAFENGKKGYYL